MMLQTILSQTQMNDLFKHTSEDLDARICNLTVENLKWLKTDVTVNQCTHIFDLFSTKPTLSQMYNQLIKGDEEDQQAYIRLNLKGLND